MENDLHVEEPVEETFLDISDIQGEEILDREDSCADSLIAENPPNTELKTSTPASRL